MKIDSTTNNNFLLRRKTSIISWLEKHLARLKVDNSTTELLELESKLKDLNLKDNKGKLLERGPITTKDTKLPTNKPYQKITENVNVRHNCGGTAFSVTNDSQQNYDNIPYSSIDNTNFEVNNYKTACSECRNFFNCDTCILQEACTPEFLEQCCQWLNEIEQSDSAELQHTLEETELNITNIKHTQTTNTIDESTYFKTYPEFIKPSVRRISQDSGFQSDNPSPRSDYVLSPKPSFTLQQSKLETVTSNFRKILPKITETQKREENVTRSTPKMNNKETKQKTKQTATEKSAKELLRSTLNAEIKQVKWIELVVQQRNDELFETCSSGKTVLHKLLQGDEKYKAESLYAIVEKMKMNPNRCSRIIAAQSSICDTIKQNKHPQLWSDYFCEAMQIIRNKMENDQTKD